MSEDRLLIWRRGAFAGHFGDLYVKDTNLEGGSSGFAAETLSLVVKKRLRNNASAMSLLTQEQVDRIAQSLAQNLDTFAELEKVHFVNNFVKAVLDRIRALEPEGEPVALPAGYRDPGGGHAITFSIYCKKASDDASKPTYTFVVHNTGEGVNYHPNVAVGGKTKAVTSLAFPGLSHERIMNVTFWNYIGMLRLTASEVNSIHSVYSMAIPYLLGNPLNPNLDLQQYIADEHAIAPAHESSEPREVTDEDLEELEKIVKQELGTISCRSATIQGSLHQWVDFDVSGDYETQQRAGVCYYRCVLAWIRYHLRRYFGLTRVQMKQVMFALRLSFLDLIEADLNAAKFLDDFSQSDALIIEIACRQTARAAIKLARFREFQRDAYSKLIHLGTNSMNPRFEISEDEFPESALSVEFMQNLRARIKRILMKMRNIPQIDVPRDQSGALMNSLSDGTVAVIALFDDVLQSPSGEESKDEPEMKDIQADGTLAADELMREDLIEDTAIVNEVHAKRPADGVFSQIQLPNSAQLELFTGLELVAEDRDAKVFAGGVEQVPPDMFIPLTIPNAELRQTDPRAARSATELFGKECAPKRIETLEVLLARLKLVQRQANDVITKATLGSSLAGSSTAMNLIEHFVLRVMPIPKPLPWTRAALRQEVLGKDSDVCPWLGALAAAYLTPEDTEGKDDTDFDKLSNYVLYSQIRSDLLVTIASLLQIYAAVTWEVPAPGVSSTTQYRRCLVALVLYAAYVQTLYCPSVDSLKDATGKLVPVTARDLLSQPNLIHKNTVVDVLLGENPLFADDNNLLEINNDRFFPLPSPNGIPLSTFLVEGFTCTDPYSLEAREEVMKYFTLTSQAQNARFIFANMTAVEMEMKDPGVPVNPLAQMFYKLLTTCGLQGRVPAAANTFPRMHQRITTNPEQQTPLEWMCHWFSTRNEPLIHELTALRDTCILLNMCYVSHEDGRTVAPSELEFWTAPETDKNTNARFSFEPLVESNDAFYGGHVCENGLNSMFSVGDPQNVQIDLMSRFESDFTDEELASVRAQRKTLRDLGDMADRSSIPRRPMTGVTDVVHSLVRAAQLNIVPTITFYNANLESFRTGSNEIKLKSIPGVSKEQSERLLALAPNYTIALPLVLEYLSQEDRAGLVSVEGVAQLLKDLFFSNYSLTLEIPNWAQNCLIARAAKLCQGDLTLIQKQAEAIDRAAREAAIAAEEARKKNAEAMEPIVEEDSEELQANQLFEMIRETPSVISALPDEHIAMLVPFAQRRFVMANEDPDQLNSLSIQEVLMKASELPSAGKDAPLDGHQGDQEMKNDEEEKAHSEARAKRQKDAEERLAKAAMLESLEADVRSINPNEIEALGEFLVCNEKLAASRFKAASSGVPPHEFPHLAVRDLTAYCIEIPISTDDAGIFLFPRTSTLIHEITHGPDVLVTKLISLADQALKVTLDKYDAASCRGGTFLIQTIAEVLQNIRFVLADPRCGRILSAIDKLRHEHPHHETLGASHEVEDPRGAKSQRTRVIEAEIKLAHFLATTVLDKLNRWIMHLAPSESNTKVELHALGALVNGTLLLREEATHAFFPNEGTDDEGQLERIKKYVLGSGPDFTRRFRLMSNFVSALTYTVSWQSQVGEAARSIYRTLPLLRPLLCEYSRALIGSRDLDSMCTKATTAGLEGENVVFGKVGVDFVDSAPERLNLESVLGHEAKIQIEALWKESHLLASSEMEESRTGVQNITSAQEEDAVWVPLSASAGHCEMIVESEHPYAPDTRHFRRVHIPEAPYLCIYFDPLSQMGSDTHYVTIYRDETCTTVWGTETYCGSFPGVNGVAPLIIPSNSFVLYFHSDYISSAFGYRLRVTAPVSEKVVVQVLHDARAVVDGGVSIQVAREAVIHACNDRAKALKLLASAELRAEFERNAASVNLKGQGNIAKGFFTDCTGTVQLNLTQGEVFFGNRVLIPLPEKIRQNMDVANALALFDRTPESSFVAYSQNDRTLMPSAEAYENAHYPYGRPHGDGHAPKPTSHLYCAVTDDSRFCKTYSLQHGAATYDITVWHPPKLDERALNLRKLQRTLASMAEADASADEVKETKDYQEDPHSGVEKSEQKIEEVKEQDQQKQGPVLSSLVAEALGGIPERQTLNGVTYCDPENPSPTADLMFLGKRYHHIDLDIRKIAKLQSQAEREESHNTSDAPVVTQTFDAALISAADARLRALAASKPGAWLLRTLVQAHERLQLEYVSSSSPPSFWIAEGSFHEFATEAFFQAAGKSKEEGDAPQWSESSQTPATAATLLMYVPPDGDLQNARYNPGMFYYIVGALMTRRLDVYALVDHGRTTQRLHVYTTDSMTSLSDLSTGLISRDVVRMAPSGSSTSSKAPPPPPRLLRHSAGFLYGVLYNPNTGTMAAQEGVGARFNSKTGSIVIKRSRVSDRATESLVDSLLRAELENWSASLLVSGKSAEARLSRAEAIFASSSLSVEDLFPRHKNTEVYIPSRFLAGSIPECLLEQYRFWRTGPATIVGYPMNSDGSIRARLLLLLRRLVYFVAPAPLTLARKLNLDTQGVLDLDEVSVVSLLTDPATLTEPQVMTFGVECQGWETVATLRNRAQATYIVRFARELRIPVARAVELLIGSDETSKQVDWSWLNVTAMGSKVPSGTAADVIEIQYANLGDTTGAVVYQYPEELPQPESSPDAVFARLLRELRDERASKGPILTGSQLAKLGVRTLVNIANHADLSTFEDTVYGTTFHPLRRVFLSRRAAQASKLLTLLTKLDTPSHILVWSNSIGTHVGDECPLSTVEFPRLRIRFEFQAAQVLVSVNSPAGKAAVKALSLTPTSEDEYIETTTTRLASLDYAGKYVVDTLSSPLRNLAAPLCNSVVLRNDKGQYFVLAANYGIIRPSYRGIPFSVETHPDKRINSWASNVRSRLLEYTVHPSLRFLVSSSFSASLYLLVSLIAKRDYCRACTLIDECFTDAPLSTEDKWIVSHLAVLLGTESHPDALSVAFRLMKLFPTVVPPGRLKVLCNNYMVSSSVTALNILKVPFLPISLHLAKAMAEGSATCPHKLVGEGQSIQGFNLRDVHTHRGRMLDEITTGTAKPSHLLLDSYVKLIHDGQMSAQELNSLTIPGARSSSIYEPLPCTEPEGPNNTITHAIKPHTMSSDSFISVIQMRARERASAGAFHAAVAALAGQLVIRQSSHTEEETARAGEEPEETTPESAPSDERDSSDESHDGEDEYADVPAVAERLLNVPYASMSAAEISTFGELLRQFRDEDNRMRYRRREVHEKKITSLPQLAVRLRKEAEEVARRYRLRGKNLPSQPEHEGRKINFVNYFNSLAFVALASAHITIPIRAAILGLLSISQDIFVPLLNKAAELRKMAESASSPEQKQELESRAANIMRCLKNIFAKLPSIHPGLYIVQKGGSLSAADRGVTMNATRLFFTKFLQDFDKFVYRFEVALVKAALEREKEEDVKMLTVYPPTDYTIIPDSLRDGPIAMHRVKDTSGTRVTLSAAKTNFLVRLPSQMLATCGPSQAESSSDKTPVYELTLDELQSLASTPLSHVIRVAELVKFAAGSAQDELSDLPFAFEGDFLTQEEAAAYSSSKTLVAKKMIERLRSDLENSTRKAQKLSPYLACLSQSHLESLYNELQQIAAVAKVRDSEKSADSSTALGSMISLLRASSSISNVAESEATDDALPEEDAPFTLTRAASLHRQASRENLQSGTENVPSSSIVAADSIPGFSFTTAPVTEPASFSFDAPEPTSFSFDASEDAAAPGVVAAEPAGVDKLLKRQNSFSDSAKNILTHALRELQALRAELVRFDVNEGHRISAQTSQIERWANSSSFDHTHEAVDLTSREIAKLRVFSGQRPYITFLHIVQACMSTRAVQELQKWNPSITDETAERILNAAYVAMLRVVRRAQVQNAIETVTELLSTIQQLLIARIEYATLAAVIEASRKSPDLVLPLPTPALIQRILHLSNFDEDVTKTTVVRALRVQSRLASILLDASADSSLKIRDSLLLASGLERTSSAEDVFNAAVTLGVTSLSRAMAEELAGIALHEADYNLEIAKEWITTAREDFFAAVNDARRGLVSSGPVVMGAKSNDRVIVNIRAARSATGSHQPVAVRVPVVNPFNLASLVKQYVVGRNPKLQSKASLHDEESQRLQEEFEAEYAKTLEAGKLLLERAGIPRNVQESSHAGMQSLAHVLKHTAANLASLLVARRVYMTPNDSVPELANEYAFDPRYLVFEFMSTFLLRPRQYEMVTDFMASAMKRQSSVQQMLMGGGKTAVVAPLLVLMLADGSRLVTQVVPKALLDMSRNALRAVFSQVVNKRVYTFQFDRSTIEQINSNTYASARDKLTRLESTFEEVRTKRGVLITTPEAVKSFLLRFFECASVCANQPFESHPEPVQRLFKPNTIFVYRPAILDSETIFDVLPQEKVSEFISSFEENRTNIVQIKDWAAKIGLPESKMSLLRDLLQQLAKRHPGRRLAMSQRGRLWMQCNPDIQQEFYFFWSLPDHAPEIIDQAFGLYRNLVPNVRQEFTELQKAYEAWQASHSLEDTFKKDLEEAQARAKSEGKTVSVVSGPELQAVSKYVSTLRTNAKASLFISQQFVRILDFWSSQKDGVAILDEVDLLLHPLKSELNFPLGEKHLIDLGARRWNLALFLTDGFFYATTGTLSIPDFAIDDEAGSALSAIRHSIEEGIRTFAIQKSPHPVIVDKEFYASHMQAPFATWVMFFLRRERAFAQAVDDVANVLGCANEDVFDLVHIYIMRSSRSTHGLRSDFANAEGIAALIAEYPETKTDNERFVILRKVACTVVGMLPSEQVKLANLTHDWLQHFLVHALSKINRVSYGLLRPADARRWSAEDSGSDYSSAQPVRQPPLRLFGWRRSDDDSDAVEVTFDPTKVTTNTTGEEDVDEAAEDATTESDYHLEREVLGGAVMSSVPLSRRLLAVPFVGKDVPSRSAEFSHPDVLLGLSIAAYRYDGLRVADVLVVFKHLRNQMLTQPGPFNERPARIQFDRWLAEAYTLFPELRSNPRARILPLELIQFSDPSHRRSLHIIFAKLPSVIHYYLTQFVFHRVMRNQKVKLTASGVDLGADMIFGTRLGFSGTPSDLLTKSLLPCRYEPGSEAAIVRTLTNPRIGSFEILSDWDVDKLLRHVAESVSIEDGADEADSGNGSSRKSRKSTKCRFQALIDTGALITGLTNEQVARTLLAYGLKGVDAVVFLDPLDRKVVVDRSGGPPVPLERSGVAPQKRFTFYDQVHTTGMDVPQPTDACAVVTLGKDLTLRDYAQGCYRLRGIGKGQRIHLMIVDEIAKIVEGFLPAVDAHKNVRGPSELAQRNTEDVLRAVVAWLTHNSMRQEALQHLALCKQEMGHQWRYPLSNLLREFFRHVSSKHEPEVHIGPHCVTSSNSIANITWCGSIFASLHPAEKSLVARFGSLPQLPKTTWTADDLPADLRAFTHVHRDFREAVNQVLSSVKDAAGFKDSLSVLQEYFTAMKSDSYNVEEYVRLLSEYEAEQQPTPQEATQPKATSTESEEPEAKSEKTTINAIDHVQSCLFDPLLIELPGEVPHPEPFSTKLKREAEMFTHLTNLSNESKEEIERIIADVMMTEQQGKRVKEGDQESDGHDDELAFDSEMIQEQEKEQQVEVEVEQEKEVEPQYAEESAVALPWTTDALESHVHLGRHFGPLKSYQAHSALPPQPFLDDIYVSTRFAPMFNATALGRKLPSVEVLFLWAPSSAISRSAFVAAVTLEEAASLRALALLTNGHSSQAETSRFALASISGTSLDLTGWSPLRSQPSASAVTLLPTFQRVTRFVESTTAALPVDDVLSANVKVLSVLADDAPVEVRGKNVAVRYACAHQVARFLNAENNFTKQELIFLLAGLSDIEPARRAELFDSFIYARSRDVVAWDVTPVAWAMKLRSEALLVKRAELSLLVGELLRYSFSTPYEAFLFFDKNRDGVVVGTDLLVGLAELANLGVKDAQERGVPAPYWATYILEAQRDANTMASWLQALTILQPRTHLEQRDDEKETPLPEVDENSSSGTGALFKVEKASISVFIEGSQAAADEGNSDMANVPQAQGPRRQVVKRSAVHRKLIQGHSDIVDLEGDLTKPDSVEHAYWRPGAFVNQFAFEFRNLTLKQSDVALEDWPQTAPAISTSEAGRWQQLVYSALLSSVQDEVQAIKAKRALVAKEASEAIARVERELRERAAKAETVSDLMNAFAAMAEDEAKKRTNVKTADSAAAEADEDASSSAKSVQSNRSTFAQLLQTGRCETMGLLRRVAGADAAIRKARTRTMILNEPLSVPHKGNFQFTGSVELPVDETGYRPKDLLAVCHQVRNVVEAISTSDENMNSRTLVSVEGVHLTRGAWAYETAYYGPTVEELKKVESADELLAEVPTIQVGWTLASNTPPISGNLADMAPEEYIEFSKGFAPIPQGGEARVLVHRDPAGGFIDTWVFEYRPISESQRLATAWSAGVNLPDLDYVPLDHPDTIRARTETQQAVIMAPHKREVIASITACVNINDDTLGTPGIAFSVNGKVVATLPLDAELVGKGVSSPIVPVVSLAPKMASATMTRKFYAEYELAAQETRNRNDDEQSRGGGKFAPVLPSSFVTVSIGDTPFLVKPTSLHYRPLIQHTRVQASRTYAYGSAARFGQQRVATGALGLEIEGSKITATSGFPTCTTAGVLLTSGCYYYEFTCLEYGLGQIGWADLLLRATSDGGLGVGDDRHSWGTDGMRAHLWYDGHINYSQQWEAGTVIGCAVDLDNGLIAFSQDGSWRRPMGLAATTTIIAGGVAPAFTLQGGFSLEYNFGDRPLAHKPPAGHQTVYDWIKTHDPRLPIHRKTFIEDELRVPTK